MRTVQLPFLLLLWGVARAAVEGAEDSDEDIVLPPVVTNTSLPERLLIFLPGASVPTANYKLTAQAIQKGATELRLTVVIVAVFQRKCIIQCPTSSTCPVLQHTVAGAVAKTGIAWQGQEDTFIAGHSMGSICANNLVKANKYAYAGLMEFGGYVDKTGDSSVSNYAIPVLHMSGELDGGGARPGKMAFYFEQYRAFADKSGQELALTRKPVHVLRGMDHSDFCPGFFVTAIKDLKSEVTQDVALATIGKGSGAFMHLNTASASAPAKAAAMATMQTMLNFTTSIVDPILQAFALEQSDDSGPWCQRAQHVVAGLSAADDKKLQVATELSPFDQFEHRHTNYTQLPGVGLKVTAIASVEASSGFGPLDIHQAAKSIDCKMVDATRVAQQLTVKTNTSVQCGDANKLAVDAALSLLPAHSRQRYEAQPRRVCILKDTGVFGNIGPLFVKGSINMTETAPCMEVSSLFLVSTIKSLIFPGNHYCKLLSPAMAMEWMMTDGLKPFPYHAPSSVSAPVAFSEGVLFV